MEYEIYAERRSGDKGFNTVIQIKRFLYLPELKMLIQGSRSASDPRRLVFSIDKIEGEEYFQKWLSDATLTEKGIMPPEIERRMKDYVTSYWSYLEARKEMEKKEKEMDKKETVIWFFEYSNRKNAKVIVSDTPAISFHMTDKIFD